MDVTSKQTATLEQKVTEQGQPNLFARLVRPHPSLQGEEQRTRSRLVATILLATVLVGGLMILFAAISDVNEIKDPDTLAAILGCVCLILAFGINRAGYTNAAASLMIVVLLAVFTVPPFMERASPVFFYYTIVPILLTAIFYSGRHVLLVAVSIAGAGLVLSQFSTRHSPEELRWAFQFLAVTSAVAYALSYHYRTRERIQRQEFQKINDELKAGSVSLEQRVAERTHDLETVTEVNAQISTILETERLLQDVVDLTKERFRLYHAHVYLLDESGQKLVLASGAGHVGRQMVSQSRQIDLNNTQSIVAEAARNRQGVIINDVSVSPTFLPNPLLPDTQSELAVPLVARGQLLGVLDVQSDKTSYFSQEVLSVMELMTGQIATAISNAQLYEVAARTSRHETAVGNINRKIQSAVDMDDILKTTARELGKALRVPYTAIELQVAGETLPTDNGSSQAEE